MNHCYVLSKKKSNQKYNSLFYYIIIVKYCLLDMFFRCIYFVFI